MKHLLYTFIVVALASCSPAKSNDRTLTMPHRIEAWGHQFTLPAGWEPMTMPESDVTLEKLRTDPKALIPLGLYGRADAQAVFTITVRPAFSDGTLSNWLGWFCDQEDIKPDAIETTQLSSGLRAAVCTATQVQSETTVRLHMACLEDGGNCYLLMALAPADQWDKAEADCHKVIADWKLLHPAGSQVAAR